MHTSDIGLSVIKQFEGLRLEVYVDIAGFRTIGFGHKLTAAETFTTITEQQADEILHRDVAIATTALQLRGRTAQLSGPAAEL